jgi:hypothetical protein
MTRGPARRGWRRWPVTEIALQRAGIYPAVYEAHPTDADPVEALLAVARGHAVYCRRDIARVLLALRENLMNLPLWIVTGLHLAPLAYP